MGPEKEGMFCAARCRTPADCGGDRCSPDGLCDRWPRPLGCDSPELCDAGGSAGFRCSAKERCQPACKRGLVLYGGTHCAKPCKGDAECPGGWCETDICVPLCPSEGCPYRWE
jgi:hypothetical protein